MIKDFEAHRIKHHRNGISGRSFWSVYFSYREDGVFHPNMLAIMPVDYDEPSVKKAMGGCAECHVIDLNDRDACWRGDSFIEHVAKAINKHKDG